MKELLKIGGVTIWVSPNEDYISFISDLDVCNDGCGHHHDDPHHIPKTAYYNQGKFLNADEDFYVVVPPQVRSMVAPTVMGCRARITNLRTNAVHDAVVGEIGPDNKTGEASYCLAKSVNPKVKHNHGDLNPIYLYELWPGTPAIVGDKHYKLEPA